MANCYLQPHAARGAGLPAGPNVRGKALPRTHGPGHAGPGCGWRGLGGGYQHHQPVAPRLGYPLRLRLAGIVGGIRGAAGPGSCLAGVDRLTLVIMLSGLPSVAAGIVFLVSAAASLAASWLLVSRLEALAGRAGLSEGMLGLVAALAADAPEITAAVSALAHHQTHVGAGVTLGSNVFNLAALLGLGAAVAGWIGLHRKVIVLGGVVALWVAAVSLVVVTGLVSPLAGIVVVAVVFVPYVVVLAAEGWPDRLVL